VICSKIIYTPVDDRKRKAERGSAFFWLFLCEVNIHEYADVIDRISVVYRNYISLVQEAKIGEKLFLQLFQEGKIEIVAVL